MILSNIFISVVMAFLQSFAATTIVFKQLKDANKKYKFEKIYFFLLMWTYCIIVFFFIPNQFRFVLSIIMISLFLIIILKTKDISTVIYALNTEIILAISEIIITIFLVLCGFNSENLVNNVFCNLLVNLLMSLLCILLVNIPFINKLLFSIIQIASKNRKITRNLFIIILLIYLIVTKNGLELILESNYYVTILFILVIVLVLTTIIKNEFKYNQIEEENKMMLNYVTKYEKIITEQGKRNHEFKNQLMVIRGYAQMNSPKLIEYIDSLTKDSNKGQSSFLISQLNKFPDGGIKGLLYYKLSIMEDYKINYEILVEKSVKTSLNSLKTSDYVNVTKILGVLLDNAIESSNKSVNKKIIIDVKKEKGFVVFRIYNTYRGKIDLSKIGTGYSTKGKGRGYGLRLVNDIVTNDENLILNNDLEDGYFVSCFKINVSKIKNTK